MTFASLLTDMQLLGALMILGFIVREFCKPIQKLYIPTSMLAGFIALLLGQQVLGVLEIPKSFGSYAGALIGVVLTCIVFGITFDKERLRNYVDYTCICIAIWGMQLLVGLPLGDFLAKIWPGLPEGWGLLGVFSFWGGHGTAGAAGTALEKLGSEGALGMGMILSTLGLMAAVTVGMVMVNWGIRKGYAAYTKVPASGYDPTLGGVLPKDKQKPIGVTRVSTSGINALIFQFAMIMFCMWFGGIIIKGLALVYAPIGHINSMVYGMLGAAIVRYFMWKTKTDGYLDKAAVNNISGMTLDIIIISAVATIKLSLVTTFIVPILIYTILVLGMTMAIGIFFCKHCCKHEWFEKACCLFGMASGAVPTGLALVRAVDPDGKSSAPDAQRIASSFFSPVFGTMPVILPALYMAGQMVYCLGIGVGLGIVPLAIAWILFARKG